MYGYYSDNTIAKNTQERQLKIDASKYTSYYHSWVFVRRSHGTDVVADITKNYRIPNVSDQENMRLDEKRPVSTIQNPDQGQQKKPWSVRGVLVKVNGNNKNKNITKILTLCSAGNAICSLESLFLLNFTKLTKNKVKMIKCTNKKIKF